MRYPLQQNAAHWLHGAMPLHGVIIRFAACIEREPGILTTSNYFSYHVFNV